jgi:hypothetical protein
VAGKEKNEIKIQYTDQDQKNKRKRRFKVSEMITNLELRNEEIVMENNHCSCWDNH